MGRGSSGGGGGSGGAGRAGRTREASAGKAKGAGGGGDAKPQGRPPQVRTADGLQYTKSFRSVVSRDVLVTVQTSKLDAAWQKDKGFYIPRGGGGAEIKGRREGFVQFLRKGKAIEASEVSVSKNGTVVFTNGRHRFSVLRDQGKKTVVIAVPRSQAKKFKDKFS